MPRAKPVPSDAPMEPLWLLRSLPYADYRYTNWWKRRREAYIATVADPPGSKQCELCGFATPNRAGIPLRFHVHHITYVRLGEEQDDDLRLLCAACHNLVHYPESHAARHWAAVERNVDQGLALRARALRPGVEEELDQMLAEAGG
jgi:hypothetical protein